MERNVSGQKITVTAIDSATGRPKTGDAANITVYVSKDDGTLTSLGDTSATEVSSTNAPGVYLFDLTQSETSAIKLVFTGKSSTSGIDIIPQTLYTTPSGWSTLTIANNAANANPTYWLGSALATPRVAGFPEVAPQGGKTIYVAASGGSDSNSGLTRSAALATVGAANTAAVSGDTIWLIAGSYSDDGTNPFVTIAKNGITIRGDGPTSTIITCTAFDGGIWLTGARNTVSDLKVNATNDGSYGVYCSGKWSVIERCELTAKEVSVVLNADLCHVRHCNLSGGRYGIKTGGYNWLLENTLCAVTSTFTLTANSNFAAIYTTSAGTIRNCTASGVSVAANSTGKLIGLSANANAVVCEGLTISLLNISATQTGGVYGIVDLNGAASVVSMTGGSITATNSGGTGAAYEIDGSVSGSNICLRGAKTTPANWNGVSNIHQALEPTVAGRTADVTATGALGIDLGNVENQSTTLALSGTTTKNTTDIATTLADATNGLAAIKTSAASAATSAETAATESTAANAVVQENLDGKVSEIEAGGGGTPAQVNNNDPVPAYTAKLGTRADGVTTAFPTLRIRPGEKTQVWVDCSKLVNTNLESANTGASTEADVDVDSVGVYGKMVAIVLDATDADDGDTATITCNAVPRGTQVLKVKLSIEVSAD